MTGISLNLPEDLSNSLADLAKTNGQTARYLAINVLRDYIEHEKTLTAHQIKLAVKEADQGKFATDEQVAAMRARRWSRNAD
ncbi:CopG family transcriptional regulator [Pseudomonas sp.]|uniref:CopG family transcriptional regulator n=1 Tax=Pseudomonas sp. TaxID=306 RepID=UPI002587F3EC|nr:CopG family transcriptional regulator [Pseudomonas sp.]